MQRLDSMTKKELKKLYYRSAWITQFGWIWLLFTIVLAFYSIQSFCTIKLDSLLVSLVILSTLPQIFVWLCVRTKLARFLFYSQAIITWAYTLMFLIMYLIEGLDFLWIAFAVLQFWTGVEVFRSARTDCLFDPDGFSHSQIVQANKKRKKGEMFTDEELISFKPNRLVSLVSLVISSIWMVVGIIGTIFEIISMFDYYRCE